ncbi:MAG: hypothetical protein LBR33_06265 [Propionibacteriaceae bacterium]|jgi:hypothetical protein|nr:hypothetical protein [Propionibacteriaceae bacterium]
MYEYQVIAVPVGVFGKKLKNSLGEDIPELKDARLQTDATQVVSHLAAEGWEPALLTPGGLGLIILFRRALR